MRILCFNKNNTSDFSVRLMQLVSQTRMCDKEMREFASGTHKYKFKPVTSIQKVRKFEKKYNITLPENYIRYLTEVGNGGAGPDYGLYSLEKVEEINEHLSQNDDFILFDLDDESRRKEWIRMCESANNDIEERCEYLKMIQRMESGSPNNWDAGLYDV